MPELQAKRARTECATCPGRINCDGIRPNCTNCSRPSRKCRWHSIKLSWPRANDRRRSVVFKPMHTAGPIPDGRFVHTSYWDVELHHRLTKFVPAHTLSLLDVPTIWNPSEISNIDQDFLEYFYCVASTSLVPFGYEITSLGRILARIGLGGESTSAMATLQALLAFSSLHRYGLQTQAIELKIAALGSLAKASAAPSLDRKETIQHVVTGMLLCSFEVHQSSCTSGQWTGYLGGVKTVINTSPLKKLLQVDPDLAVLLDWVHYHDVLAHFSLLYWKGTGAPELPSTPLYLLSPQISNRPVLISSMLNLLFEVCDAVSSMAIPPQLGDHRDEYKGFLEVLDWRIRSLPIPKLKDDNEDALDEASLLMQLYQLALLLFLNRCSEGLIDQPTRMQQHIEKAFTILPRLSSCRQQFPIHVVGCEARTDDQRAAVLDLISRTEDMSSSRSFHYCKRILEAVWAQDDLACGNSMSYHDTLVSVMGLCKNVPSFI